MRAGTCASHQAPCTLSFEESSRTSCRTASASVCGVTRKRGLSMRGGLRWPSRPFQVTCVLVASVPTAAFSPRAGFTARAALSRDQRRPGNPGERRPARGRASASGCRNSLHPKFAGHRPAERNAGKYRRSDFPGPGSGAIQSDRGLIGLSMILIRRHFHPGSSPGFFAGSCSQRRARERLGNQEIGASGSDNQCGGHDEFSYSSRRQR
jgi:hypothetical protein